MLRFFLICHILKGNTMLTTNYLKSKIDLKTKLYHKTKELFLKNYDYYDNLNKPILDDFAERYGLRIKQYDDLYVINYALDDNVEIDENGQPLPDKLKHNAMVKECRSLIIDKEFNVVSRSFDRFFNYGETDHKEFNFNDFKVYDKADGSLIKIYWYKDNWHISTKGTSDGSGEIPNTKITFRDAILKDIFKNNLVEFTQYLSKENTYIFEYVSPINQVVVKYDSDKLILLAIRNKNTGFYAKDCQLEHLIHKANNPNIIQVKSYEPKEINALIKYINNDIPFNEGVVIVDNNFNRIKIKTTEYVHLHYLKGNILTDKKILTMIYDNAYKEYISYFPDEEPRFHEWFKIISDKTSELELFINDNKHLDKKSFALTITNSKHKDFMFALMRSYNNNEPINLITPNITLNKFIRLFLLD